MEAVAAGLILIFCICALLPHPGRVSAWGLGALVADKYPMQEVSSKSGMRMEKILDRAAPDVRISQAGFRTGERIALWEQIEVQTGGSSVWVQAAGNEEVLLEILDVWDEAQNSLRKGAFEELDEASGELTAPLSCSAETGEFLFHQSGKYKVKMKITDSYGRTVIKEIMIPVEAG